MTHDGMENVWEWENFVAQSCWDDVENWWKDNYFSKDRSIFALKALLDMLEGIVPKIAVENGMERMQRHLRVSDDPDVWRGHEHLKGAAAILQAGELAAAIEGTPPTASNAWAEYRAMIEQKLAHFLAAEAPTTGVEELAEIDAARVLEETAVIALSDIRDLFDQNGLLLPVEAMPEKAAKAIQSIKVSSKRVPGSASDEIMVTTEIKFWDKNAALERLFKHFGLYEQNDRDDPCQIPFAHAIRSLIAARKNWSDSVSKSTIKSVGWSWYLENGGTDF